MNKIYYLDNNKIKLVRHIISYTEETVTDTLEMTKNITQYLNSDEDLKELEKRLTRKGVKFNVVSNDITELEVYENRKVDSVEEAEELLNL